MKTSRQAKLGAARRLAYGAALLCIALAFSYLEAIAPISLVIPLPGIRLGLANIAVMLAFFCLSPIDAALVSFARIALSALLFGSPVSFFFSLCGGALAYLSLFLSRPLVKNGKMSFIGASVISSALHGSGQIIAAAIVYGVGAWFYLPVILLFGAPFGALVGLLLNILYPRTEKIINANSK